MVIILRLLLLLIMMSGFITAFNSYDAEELYKKGHYDQALTIYTELIKQHTDNGPLWYNLGNTYLKTNQIGYAIFSYRKSAQLMGYDSDLSKNLAIARQEVINQVNDTDSFIILVRDRLMRLSIVNLFWIANSSLLILLIIYLIYIRKRYRPELMRNVSLTIFIATLLSWSLFGAVYYQQISLKYSVIIAEKTAVKSGPSKILPTLFYIHEGIELTILAKSNDWAKVKLNNGLEGWVKLSHMELI